MTGLGVSYRLELDTAGLVDLDAVAAVADAFLSKPSSFTGETVAKQVVGDRLELHKTAVAGQSRATAEAVRAVMSQHGALRPFTLTEVPAGDHPGARTEFIPGHGLRSPRPPWPEQEDPAHRVGMDTKAALPASLARSTPEQGQSSWRRTRSARSELHSDEHQPQVPGRGPHLHDRPHGSAIEVPGKQKQRDRGSERRTSDGADGHASNPRHL